MATSSPHPSDLARRREQRAIHLRALGYTYDAVASSLLPCPTHPEPGRRDCPACLPMYTNRSSAKKAVDRALAREYEAGANTREQLRRHQLAQIDLLLQRAMVEALGNRDGHLEAMRNATRLLDRRARLLGLDAPTRITMDSELDAQIAALVEQVAAGAVGPSVLS